MGNRSRPKQRIYCWPGAIFARAFCDQNFAFLDQQMIYREERYRFDPGEKTRHLLRARNRKLGGGVTDLTLTLGSFGRFLPKCGPGFLWKVCNCFLFLRSRRCFLDVPSCSRLLSIIGHYENLTNMRAQEPRSC